MPAAGNDTRTAGNDAQFDVVPMVAPDTETCLRASDIITVRYASDAPSFPTYEYASAATLGGPTIIADPMRIVAPPEEDLDSITEQMDTVSRQIEEQEHEVDDINQDLEEILNDLREQRGLPPVPPTPPELSPLPDAPSTPPTPEP